MFKRIKHIYNKIKRRRKLNFKPHYIIEIQLGTEIYEYDASCYYLSKSEIIMSWKDKITISKYDIVHITKI